MIKILRAHAYDHVAAICHELERLPANWLATIADIPWLILPQTLSPLWIGIMEEERIDKPSGRRYSEIGGWFCGENFDPNWKQSPHIFLDSHSFSGALEEAAHALAVAWCVPVAEFYKPEAAFYDYMGRDEDEYFAHAVMAFLNPTTDDKHWNNTDLAKRDPRLWLYLTSKLDEEGRN